MQARAGLSKRMAAFSELVLVLSLSLEVCGSIGCSKSPRFKEIGCCASAIRCVTHGTEADNPSLTFIGGKG